MKQKVLTRKEILQRVAIVGIAVFVLLLGLVLLYVWEERHSLFPDTDGEHLSGVVEHEGKRYTLRNDVDTVLVMGLDKLEADIDNNSYNNDQQADFLMLLVIDHRERLCTAIHINRDTMAEVTVLGIGGKKVGTVTQQIALSHTYGSGEQDSCRNTVKAVSGLLCGIHIDYYVSLTMDAVSVLNDLVGGVTVEILEDLTVYDAALREGETVTLMGEQALYYVRHRYGLEDTTNASRMERQRQYIQAFYDRAVACAESDGDFPADVALALSDYMISDCSATTFEQLFRTATTYDIEDIHTIDGELTVGEHMEFYPDEASVKDLIIELFYEVKE